MMIYLLACGAGVQTGDTVDTGTTQVVDTATNDETTLQSSYGWISGETGVATGSAFADLDGDGYAELIVSYGNDVQRGPIAIHDNVEGELTQNAVWLSEEFHYYGMIDTGDVNGDGLIDVVASVFLGDDGFSEPGGVQLFLNDGEWLESTPSWEYSGVYSFSSALGDVDLDGDLDLAVAVGEAYYNEPGRSLLFENGGSGNFGDEPAWSTEADRHSFDVVWSDFNDDGMLDLLFANSGSGHTIYINTGGLPGSSPWWTASGDSESFEGNSATFGDVNGDGVVDAVVSDNMQLGGVGLVRGWCGPSFDLCWESGDTPAYQSAVAFEDTDGDGDQDLVAGSWWGTARVYARRGGSLDTTPSWFSDDSIVVESFAFEDIDGSDLATDVVSGTGLLRVPGRPLTISGGVYAGGWASGPGEVEVTYAIPYKRDLFIANWENHAGNPIYFWR